MRRTAALGLALLAFTLAALAAGCSNAREYPFTGQVLSVDPSKQELTVKHEDIRGFMPGMTMPFRVADGKEFASVAPGDLITATLVVEETTGHLENVVKTGSAPLPPEAKLAPRIRLIDPGTEVPDVTLTDQDGKTRRISDWRGTTLAVTFVYTRCPLPNFCPLMDRHFATVQEQLKKDAALASRVRLLSVSFDPDYDTPAILKAHATRVGADPAIWSYVTGTREGIDPFASVFGVAIMRDDKPMQEILHNLRTVIIDKQGRLSNTLNGNEWKPEELMAAIRRADAQH